MENVVNVAAYLVKKYFEEANEPLDEMKLHKLLYFVQRESYAIVGEPAFDASFEGWVYGPVCPLVRSLYSNGEILISAQDVSDCIKYIANNVIYEYGHLESWKLSKLSHKESSWQNARVGLAPNENGHKPLRLEDIKKDSEKIRPYDHVWDMYYDEFETEAVLP